MELTQFILHSQFRIVGYDVMGNESEASEPVTVTTLEDKAAPVVENISPNADVVRHFD